MVGLMLDFVWSNLNKGQRPPKVSQCFLLAFVWPFSMFFQLEFRLFCGEKLLLITLFTNYDPLVYEVPVSK